MLLHKTYDCHSWGWLRRLNTPLKGVVEGHFFRWGSPRRGAAWFWSGLGPACLPGRKWAFLGCPPLRLPDTLARILDFRHIHTTFHHSCVRLVTRFHPCHAPHFCWFNPQYSNTRGHTWTFVTSTPLSTTRTFDSSHGFMLDVHRLFFWLNPQYGNRRGHTNEDLSPLLYCTRNPVTRGNGGQAHRILYEETAIFASKTISGRVGRQGQPRTKTVAHFHELNSTTNVSLRDPFSRRVKSLDPPAVVTIVPPVW